MKSDNIILKQKQSELFLCSFAECPICAFKHILSICYFQLVTLQTPFRKWIELILKQFGGKHNYFVNTLYKSYGKNESQECRVTLTRCKCLLDFENFNIMKVVDQQ